MEYSTSQSGFLQASDKGFSKKRNEGPIGKIPLFRAGNRQGGESMTVRAGGKREERQASRAQSPQRVSSKRKEPISDMSFM